MNPKKIPLAWTYSVSAFLILITAIGVSCSRLIFAPVPWPDGSAFYLPGLELFSWPPEWRMHSQAAFVPSYDFANFNLMPALPILLGLCGKLGLVHVFSAPLMIKLVSLVGQCVWAWYLWQWLLKTRSLVTASCIGLAALWDPIIRWGTLVVRTETWVALCWILIVRELWKSPKTFWKVSAYLALSAYFHFEAIILVPAVAIGVLPKNARSTKYFYIWFKSLLQIGSQTLLFLSPWIIYVLSHANLFLDQMNTQFFRLAGSNKWIANPYLLFHSLFLEQGSPAGLPKFFNLAKGIFWILIFVLSFSFLRKITFAFRHDPTPPKDDEERLISSASWAAGIAFFGSFYLWCTKAEVWFVALCHLMFWPWVAAVVLEQFQKSQLTHLTRFLVASSAFYASFSLIGSVVQSQQIQPIYSWNEYQRWVGCIETTIDNSVHHSAPRVWQPHVPDVLVELSSRRPHYDLTRALDFIQLEEFAWQYTQKADVLILSEFFDRSLSTNSFESSETLNYEGLPRPADVEVQTKVPFGAWSLSRLPKEQPHSWSTHICQFGPFWASVLTRLPK